MEELEGYVTAKEAATLIGIHRNNVLKAIRAGKLDGRRLFGRLVLRKVDAEAYRDKRQRKEATDD